MLVPPMRITNVLQSPLGFTLPTMHCKYWHTTANKDATTPNIVGPTLMLRVVAFVCTKLYHFYRMTQTFFLIVCPFILFY